MLLLALLKRLQMFFFGFALSAAGLMLVSLAVADIQNDTVQASSGGGFAGGGL
jgi:hypothetical protein